MKHVIVLGAGFAGLAATVKLTQLGHKVTLIERRHQVGGRAFSFTDSATQDTVDNGQHLLMRCYEATRTLLQILDAHDHIVFQDTFQIEFRHPQRGTSTLRIPKSLPTPLDVMVGFLRYSEVGLKDIFPLQNLKNQLTRALPVDLSVAQWLSQCKQTQAMMDSFWTPLCLAALNEQPDQASAKHLQAVLNEGFFASANGAHLGYSRVGLSNLLCHKTEIYLEEHNQTLRLGDAAKRIDTTHKDQVTVHLNREGSETADAVICAIPPHALSPILPEAPFTTLKECLTHYRPSPILSVNLWYDRPCLSVPFIGLLGTQMEWAFSKSLLFESHDQAAAGHITLIASAAHHLANRKHAELIDTACHEFCAVEPKANAAKLQHARVICEHRATQTLPLGHTPPATRTNHPKVWLAGDWTDTGLPATIEGAVRSGFEAATQVDHI